MGFSEELTWSVEE